MNNKINEALVILSEECGELVQVSSKTLRWGLASEYNENTNRDRLAEEAGDVLAMIGILVELGVMSNEELNERIAVKRNKLTKWSNLFNETEV